MDKNLQNTYAAVHNRLWKERGHASLRRCVDCGQQAAHWSYEGKIGGYSSNLKRYRPRCIRCHRLRDGEARAAEPKSYVIPVDGCDQCAALAAQPGSFPKLRKHLKKHGQNAAWSQAR